MRRPVQEVPLVKFRELTGNNPHQEDMLIISWDGIASQWVSYFTKEQSDFVSERISFDDEAEAWADVIERYQKHHEAKDDSATD